MEDAFALTLEVAAGIGLAACAGLRAFLPLFVIGATSRMGFISLSPSFRWLDSWPALVVFGVAVATEILADKIPWVDHGLDLLHGILKPAAGSILAAAVLTDLTPLQATILGIVVGGSTAGIVHVGKAHLRIVSTSLTAGLLNPVLSIVEDGASLLGTVLALMFPLFLLTLLAAIAVLIVMLVSRTRPRHGQLPAAGS